MWRVLTFCVGALMVLSFTVVDAQIIVACGPNDNITVTIDIAENPNMVDGFITFPENADCRENFTDFGDELQSAIVLCFNYTVGVEFQLLVVSDIVVASPDDVQLYNITCETEDFTATFNADITKVVPLASALFTTVEPSSGSSTFIDGDEINIYLSVPPGFTVKMLFMDVFDSTNTLYELVEGGCARDTPFNTTLIGDPPGVPPQAINVTLPASSFGEFEDALNRVPGVTVTVVIGAIACLESQNPSACFVDGICDKGLQYGRRRRQAPEPYRIEEHRFTIYIFKTQADRETFYNYLLQEAMGDEGETVRFRDPDDLCVNSNVTVGIASILGCAFLFCLLSTIVIGAKLHKSGKPGHQKFENSTKGSISSRDSTKMKR